MCYHSVQGLSLLYKCFLRKATAKNPSEGVGRMRRPGLAAISCAAAALVFTLGAPCLRGGREGVPVSGAEPLPVNVNTADAQELRLLPGIGEVKAAAILEYRLEHGPFSDVAGLLEVPGLGEATLEGFRDYVCVDTQEDDS